MALKIEKLLSQQSLPLSKTNNIINFVVPELGTHTDFSQSYIQLGLQVTSPTSAHLSFGHNQKAYYPNCMVRRSRLVSSKKGVIFECNNLNILMQNLLWHNKTTSENISDSLFGWGAVESDLYVKSVFTEAPAGTNAYVKIPFAHLFPGSLSSDLLPSEVVGELTIQLELEPTKNLFQQVVGERWASAYEDVEVYNAEIQCTNASVGTDSLVTTEPNTWVQVGDHITVTYIENGAQVDPIDNIITQISQDQKTLTITSEIPDGATDISYTFNNQQIHCNPFVGTGAVVSTLTVPANSLSTYIYNGVAQQFNGEIQDVTQGPLPLAVQVNYWTYVTTDDTQLTESSLNTTITNMVVNQNKTVTLTLSTPLPSVVNTKTVAGIEVQPLNTNINNAVWTVQEAYCFPYRFMNMKEDKADKILLTTYTYEPLPFVSDGNSFAREILVAPNTTNCFLLMPPSTDTDDLYSVLQGVNNYRFFLNDVALSNIPIEMNTNLDLDMLMRVFNNSEYPVRNLYVLKNDPLYINNEGAPQVYVAKIKPRMLGGRENYNPEDRERKPLRVEINGQSMAQAKTIYFFKEEMKVV